MSAADIDLNATIGAGYVGSLFAAVLYGITSLQTYIYYTRSQQDGMSMKVTVFFLWILDGVQMALVAGGMYYYMIISYGNPSALLTEHWTLTASALLLTVTDSIVRIVLGKRIWILSGKNRALAIALAISFAFASTTTTILAIKTHNLHLFSEFRIEDNLLVVASAAGIVCDVTITVSLCVLLIRSRTGFQSTDNILRKLVFYSIRTGLLMSVVLLAGFITFITMPNNYLYIAISFVLSKIYLNALLTNLNARDSLRQGTAAQSLSTSLSGVHEIDLSTARSFSTGTVVERFEDKSTLV